MDQKSNSFLETEKIGRLMRKYSVPCIISLLVAALYNIVDQIFIANADYLGSYGNAANTVVFPLTIVALAFAVMIGGGCCAFVSISLGAGKLEDAHRSVGNAILLCIICSIIITAAYLIFMDPILTLFGGKVNSQTYECAKEYFLWITLGIPFYMFGQAANPLIRSDGSPRFAMAATVLGAVINIILDPIFIFPLQMGMKGAAVATVMGQIVTALLSLWYFCHMKAVKLGKHSFGLWPGLMKRFLILGLTSFLAQVSLVISMAAVQNMCTKYGAIDPVFGQQEYAQNESACYTAFAVKSFRIYLCMMILATVNKGTFIYLQAMGKAIESTVISLTREIIFGVALPIILPVFFGLDGLLYSFPAADILTFIIACVIIRSTCRELSS